MQNSPQEISLCYISLDWENLHSLPERLVALGIMGDQLRAPLKPHNTIVL